MEDKAKKLIHDIECSSSKLECMADEMLEQMSKHEGIVTNEILDEFTKEDRDSIYNYLVESKVITSATEKFDILRGRM